MYLEMVPDAKAITNSFHQQILEPLHYLAVLGRRPAALDHSDVFRSWQLPACFAELRGRLERREGRKVRFFTVSADCCEVYFAK